MGQKVAKGASSSSSKSGNYKVSSILNDEDCTVVLEGKESTICLSDGTALGLANVCKLYERSYHSARAPITPRDYASAEDDEIVVTPQAGKEKEKGRRSFRRKKSKVQREFKNDEQKCLEMIERLFMLLLRTKKGRRELVNLSLEPLEQILKSDNLMVNDEYTLFLLIGAWADNRIEVKGLEKTLLSSAVDGVVINDGEHVTEQEAVKSKDKEPELTDSSENERTDEEKKKSLEDGEGDADKIGKDKKDKKKKKKKKKKKPKTDSDGDKASVEMSEKGNEDNNEAEKEKEEPDKEPEKEKENQDDVQDEKEDDATGKKEPTTSEAAPTSWACSLCTYANDSSRETCEMCDGAKPSKENAAAQASDDSSSVDIVDLNDLGDFENLFEKDDSIVLPEWKSSEEYLNELKEEMAPLLKHIRFPLMLGERLVEIEESGLVPREQLTDAYRQIFIQANRDLFSPDVTTVKPRKFTTTAVWDTNWHGQHIAVSPDGKKVTKQQPSWYSLAFGKEGYSTGLHYFAIKVNGKEAHVGLARKEISQRDNYLGADTNSWSYNMKGQIANGGAGMSGGGSAYGETYTEGDVIGMKLDMYRKELSYYKNGKNLGVAFTNLPAVKLYPAVGWRQGYMTFVAGHFATG